MTASQQWDKGTQGNEPLRLKDARYNHERAKIPNLAIKVDTTITKYKEHGWVGNRMKERALQRELHRVLPADFDRFDELFELVKARDEYR